MAAKRKTAGQRRREQLDAFRTRLIDIYSGACGREFVVGDEWASAEELRRIIPAVREVFGTCRAVDYVYRPHCLEHWDDPAKLAEWLFEAGFRADMVWEDDSDDAPA